MCEEMTSVPHSHLNASVLLAQSLYVCLQLYVIIKYSNLIVNRSKGLARFAFMHCIASSLCSWISTIVSEITDELVLKMVEVDEPCTALTLTNATLKSAHSDAKFNSKNHSATKILDSILCSM